MDFAKIDEKSSSLDPAYVIVFTFIAFIVILLGYLYFTNKQLMEKGLHQNKKQGKKSKKNKTYWSIDG